MEDCKGDCGTCPIQCGNKLVKKIEKEDENQMGELMKTSGCGAPKTAENMDINNKINFLNNKIEEMGKPTPFSFSLKATVSIGLVIGVIGFIVAMLAFAKISNIEAMARSASYDSSMAIDKANKAFSKAETAHSYARDIRRDFKNGEL